MANPPLMPEDVLANNASEVARLAERDELDIQMTGVYERPDGNYLITFDTMDTAFIISAEGRHIDEIYGYDLTADYPGVTFWTNTRGLAAHQAPDVSPDPAERLGW